MTIRKITFFFRRHQFSQIIPLLYRTTKNTPDYTFYLVPGGYPKEFHLTPVSRRQFKMSDRHRSMKEKGDLRFRGSFFQPHILFTVYIQLNLKHIYIYIILYIYLLYITMSNIQVGPTLCTYRAFVAGGRSHPGVIGRKSREFSYTKTS